jgi:Uma2 family endonuclease
METITKPTTAAELAALGDDAPFELIQGVLYETMPTKYDHGRVTGNFSGHLFVYKMTVMPGDVVTGEAGFFLEQDPDSVVAPDVAFIGADRIPPPDRQHEFGRVVPHVVVEVLSPSNTSTEIKRKLAVYRRAGVPLVWDADPIDQTVTAYFRDGRVRVYHIGEELDGGDVLPGFRVPVAEFFR